MNISGLLRGVMGDMKAGAPKTLELKTGEVVKGTVVQSISEQEALVNIGGVQVRARLEAPMKQGEVTMLQVQPPSDSGQVVLKPLNSSNVQIAEVSLGDVLKAVGLSDSPAQRQLVQLLHQAGIALTKENVQAFAGLAAQLPADVSLDEWLPSAVVAFQKGLPLTPETVTSVKQAVQGPPLHETLSQLAALAEQELGDSTELSPQTKELLRSVRQLVDQVRQTAGQLLKAESSATAASAGDAETVISGGQPQQGAAASAEPADGQMVRQGAGLPAAGGQLASVPPRAGAIPAAAEGMPAEGPPAGNKAASLTPSASPAQPESAAAGAAPKLAAAAGTPASQAGLPAAPKLAAAAGTPASQAGLPAAGQQGPASTGAPQAAGTGLSQPAPAGSGAAQAQAGGEVPPPGAAAPSAAQGSAGAGAPPPEGAAASAAQAGAKPALATAAPAAAPSGEAAARPDAQPSPSAGSATAPQGAATAADAPAARSGQAPAQPAAAETQAPNAPAGEHVLSRLMKALGVEHEYHSLKQIDRDPAEQAPFPAAAGPDAQKTADTLKSVLLQLSQASDVPTNVKEAAQQAVQQITGQQLLLTQDRTALFSHMTLFVPIIDANGEQTAAVHIQSRKGKNGRLDASNCRLVFDLQMKALGDTMIDVQVVNRIVSLHIHNNLPFVQQLLETNKEEIAQGLASVGYQFISMKCSPYPDKTAARAEGSSTPSGAADSPSAQLASVYGRTPYKGVDIRL